MADPRPTVHVTNWSSRKLHGPGRKFTIMAKPRHFERGDGTVVALVPSVHDLEAVRAGRISVDQYRANFLRGRAVVALEPRLLVAIRGTDRALAPLLVADGDTLCCACSREDAAAGKCHRVWAADLLVEKGWNVILDGRDRNLELLAEHLHDNDESIVGRPA